MYKLSKFFYIVVIVISFLFFKPCEAMVFSGFSYPESAKDTSILPISLRLGEGWTANTGKKYIGHLGEDFVGDVGNPVYAIADGIVEYVSGWPNCPRSKNHGWGPVIIIKHFVSDPLKFNTDGTILSEETEKNPSQIFAQYSHLTNVLVTPGQHISKGEKIAEIGSVCPYIPHLHFEIKDSESLKIDSGNGGAGTGYSGIDGYAPHRYKPSAFIDLNKDLVVEDEISAAEEPTAEPEKSTNFFWSNLWNSLLSWQIWHVFTKPSNSSLPTAQELSDVPIEEIDRPSVPLTEQPLYALSFAKSPLIVEADPGQEVLVSILATNDGNTPWQNKNISLNVVGGQAQNAVFYHESWLTKLRPTRLDQSQVEAQENGSFSFRMRVPQEPGTVDFRVQVVREDHGSFVQIGNIFFTIRIIVSEQQESSQPLPQQEVLSEKIVPPTFPKDVTPPPIEIPLEKTPVEQKSIVKKVIDFFKRLTGGGGSSQEEPAVEPIPESFPDDPVEIDTTPVPSSIEITSIADGYITTSSVIIVEGTAMGDVASVMLEETTSTVSVTQTVWSFPVDLSLGTSTLAFVGLDNNGIEITAVVSTTIFRDTEIITPDILPSPIVTTAPTIATSDTIILEGIASSTISVVSGTNEILTVTSTVIDGEWSMTVPLEEGANTFAFVGMDTQGISSASSSFVIERDTTPPVVSFVTLRHGDELLETTILDEEEDVSFEVQFLFPPGPGDVFDICPDGSSIFIDSESPLLQSFPDLISTFLETPCVWFTQTTTSSVISFPIAAQIQTIPVIARVRGTDAVGNGGD
ncbi:MAG: hypothetical protein COU30_05720, partial [Candidatus Magasanikbacteria bacterium CG10_big_fil_rev_8_21_14_0_10_38_6]